MKDLLRVIGAVALLYFILKPHLLVAPEVSLPMGRAQPPISTDGLPATYQTITPPAGSVLSELKSIDSDGSGKITDAKLVEATRLWISQQFSDEAYARAVASWEFQQGYKEQFS